MLLGFTLDLEGQLIKKPLSGFYMWDFIHNSDVQWCDLKLINMNEHPTS